MKRISSKRLLQMMMCLLALAPLLTGILGLSGIDNPIYPALSDSKNILLDSNLRFFNGISIGLGLVAFAVVPDIDKKAFTYRVLWGIIFLGGLGRLLSVFFVGLPPAPMPLFMAVEILGPVVFVYWHNRLIANESDTTEDSIPGQKDSA